MTFQEIFFYILILLGILPTLFYFKKGSKNKDYLKFLLPFILYFFIASFYELIFTHILQIDTTIWFRTYRILEFFSLLYFYNKLLGRNKLFLVWTIVFVFSYLYLIHKWIYFPRVGYNRMLLDIIITLMVVVSTIIWLIDVFKKMEEESFYTNPLFYIIGAILLFYCSTFIVYIVTDYMKQYKMKIREFYMIVYYANLVLRGTLTIVCWKASRNKI